MSIDFNSEVADTYISQMRQLENAGDPNKVIRRRPAINAAERDTAKKVRIRVDRSTFGYVAPHQDIAFVPRCSVCGATEDLRETHVIYIPGATLRKLPTAWSCATRHRE